MVQAARSGSADHLTAIAAEFDFNGRIEAIRPLGNGNVNATYRVDLRGGGERRFVLQRINTGVFRRPEHLMGNMLACTRHLHRKLHSRCDALAGRRWDVPSVLLTRTSRQPWLVVDGTYWRALRYIENAHTFEAVTHPSLAREVGSGLGTFHALISDLAVDELSDTLEGFHITPGYLRRLDEALTNPRRPIDAEVARAIACVQDRRGGADVLEKARERGVLRLRPIHGDPKINNVMMDRYSERAVALIDLDTVKPGLIHYDIGDCLRSACNPLGEETDDPDAVHFDPDLFQAVLEGYIAAARSFLTPADYDHIVEAARLLALELGIRFLTDHLAGDVYFRVRGPGQNLRRALVQLRLTQSIERQQEDLRARLAALR